MHSNVVRTWQRSKSGWDTLTSQQPASMIVGVPAPKTVPLTEFRIKALGDLLRYIAATADLRIKEGANINKISVLSHLRLQSAFVFLACLFPGPLTWIAAGEEKSATVHQHVQRVANGLLPAAVVRVRSLLKCASWTR